MQKETPSPATSTNLATDRDPAPCISKTVTPTKATPTIVEPEEEVIDIDDSTASGRLSALRKEISTDSNEHVLLFIFILVIAYLKCNLGENEFCRH